jgi:hypothetical protein
VFDAETREVSVAEADGRGASARGATSARGADGARDPAVPGAAAPA